MELPGAMMPLLVTRPVMMPLPPKVHGTGVGYRHNIPVIRAWNRNSLDNDPLLKRKHSPLSPGSLIADAASDVGQVLAFTLSWQ